MEFQRKMMPYLGGLIRDGYAVAEVPWVLRYGYKKTENSILRFPKIDCFDFQYIKPFNFSCSEDAYNVADMSWTCRSEVISATNAKILGVQGTWINVDEALGANAAPYSDDERLRRETAGYPTDPKEKSIRVHYYWGFADSLGVDYQVYGIVAANGTVLKATEITPYSDGENPFVECKWIELDSELYGMGIFETGEKQQKEINDRRNYVNDNLFAALYNMWTMSSDCGYKNDGGKLFWEAFKVLEMENVEGLKPLRPPLDGITYAKSFEEVDTAGMRRASGASSTLQAVGQGNTATESQIIHNEATRRLRAIARSQVGSTLKRFIYKAHSRDLQFLDRKTVVRVMGPEGELLYTTTDRHGLSPNPDFVIKMSTDLDFRPFKQKQLIEFLQVFAQMAKAEGAKYDSWPIIEKIAATYDINPKDFKRELDINRAMTLPETQKEAMNQIISESPGASRIRDTGLVPA